MKRFLLIAALAVLGVTAAAAAPTPTAVCPPALPSRLILHERGRVSTDDPRPLNLRDGPGTGNNVLAQIPAGGILYVLDGPRCSQSYAWYRVEYKGIVGWVAEGDDTAYYVEIYPPGW